MRKIRLAAWLVAAFCVPALVAAHPVAPKAAVQLNGETLIVLQSGVGSITAAERAAVVNRRLARFFESSSRPPRVRAEKSESGWLVMVGDQPLISVTDGDARAAHVSPQALAERWSGEIQEGVTRSYRSRLRTVLWLIVKTILLASIALATLWGLRFLYRRLGQSLETRRGKIPTLRFRGLDVLSGDRLHAGLKRLLWLIYVVAALLVLTGGLLLLFAQFPATQEYARKVFLWIWEPVLDIARGAIHYLPNLFYILVIIVVTRVALRGVSFVFEQAHRGVISLEPWIHRDVARPTSQIFKAILVVLALFFIAPLVPGTGSSAAKGISVILGLMVSFGSTSTVGNLIAGIVLTYMRPFQLGDRVKLGDTVGDVTEKTFLYTKVLTIKNEQVMVPSLQALSGALINYSAKAKDKGLILHTSVTIGYDAPWRRVHELLLQAADRTARVLKGPTPFILQTALDDFYVSYQLNVYTDQPNQMANIYAELHQNIQDAFNEGGVEICSPHFYQLRDGNPTTIPAEYLHGYEPPRFLVDSRVTQSVRP
jgi:small-conductance mechanosensitive channel